MTAVAVKSFKFPVITVYAPNCTERHSYFRELGPYLDGLGASTFNRELECYP